MPQYERGHSGQEIGEMQQRLADLGYEVTPTYEFDEYTEDALRRYQTDWLYAEGTGVADEQTLTQLEYHHANRDPGQFGGQQYGEEPGYEPVYEAGEAGAGGSAQVSEDGQHWWDGQQWNPFANPTPLVGEGEELPTGLLDSDTIDEINRRAAEAGQGYDDGQYNPFANPTPFVDGGQELPTGLLDSDTIDEINRRAAEAGQGYGDSQFDPFANPTPPVDSGTFSEFGEAAASTYEDIKQGAGELWDGVVDEASKIASGEEPMPDVRN
jgi:Putative peptidoglycan binding domain